MKRWKALRCSEVPSREEPDTDTRRSRQTNCCLSYLLWSDDKSLALLPPERKTHPGIGAVFCECVNPASTRWINAIIGQTWRGENPFKARKAKQGPWLIHLANLRVMYECQGTLVRRGRGECLLAQGVEWMVRGGFAVAEQTPRDLPFPPRCSPSQRTNKWRLDVEMTKRWTECTGREGRRNGLQMRWGNVAVVRWAAEWVLPRFAIKVSISSCRLLYFLRLKSQYFF